MADTETVSLAEMDRRVQHWIDNGGREELARVQAEAKAASERVREALRPDPELLRQPVTI